MLYVALYNDRYAACMMHAWGRMTGCMSVHKTPSATWQSCHNHWSILRTDKNSTWSKQTHSLEWLSNSHGILNQLISSSCECAVCFCSAQLGSSSVSSAQLSSVSWRSCIHRCMLQKSRFGVRRASPMTHLFIRSKTWDSLVRPCYPHIYICICILTGRSDHNKMIYRWWGGGRGEQSFHEIVWLLTVNNQPPAILSHVHVSRRCTAGTMILG